MTTENPLLLYKDRRYGMDHSRYAWSMLEDRDPVQWPEEKKVALWVNISLQFFPLNQKDKTFQVPGGMRMPYPDLRHFSLQDYGNRVGIYRILRILDKYGLKPTIAMNAQVAQNYPALRDRIVARGDEIIAHGLHMDALHHSGISPELERERVHQTLKILREQTGQSVQGWLSPGKSQSFITPELLAENGIRYMCDWVNDALPYTFHTNGGDLVALPLSTELEDTFILINNLHPTQSYVEQINDAMYFLRREAHSKGGRLLALSIHPWLLGQPHRIKQFEAMIQALTAHDDVWCATSSEIINAAGFQMDSCRTHPKQEGQKGGTK